MIELLQLILHIVASLFKSRAKLEAEILVLRQVETVDQWYGQDYCYFKIKGNDGNLYILRFDEGRAEWELTMFQSPGASATTSDGPDQSRTPRNEFHAGVRAAMIKISSGAPRGLSSHPRF